MLHSYLVINDFCYFYLVFIVQRFAHAIIQITITVSERLLPRGGWRRGSDWGDVGDGVCGRGYSSAVQQSKEAAPQTPGG